MDCISECFKNNKVVPDVLSTPPKETLQIKYGDVKVNFGNELTPTQVKDPPLLTWPSEEGGFYLLCMTDPDAPSRKSPNFREWHHWLVGNIVGNDIANGDILSEYIGSGPPKNTGLHRYVFVVYKQPNKLTFSEQKLLKNSGEHRGRFSIAKFAEKYQLGEPVAGNFFQAQYDDYVPKLQAQLKG